MLYINIFTIHIIMFSRIILFPIVFLTSTQIVLSQSNLPSMTFGKVPAADLQMTVYEQDTAAAAVVLGDYGLIDFRFDTGDPSIEFQRHRRIKILKRSGFDYGDVSLGYYSRDNIEDIRKYEAMVYSPDGTRTRLKKKDFFLEEIDDTYARLKFSFPNLEEGCIIEYKYSLYSEDLFTLPEWYFQRSIPTRYSQFQIEIPEWLDYVTLNQGRSFDVQETEARRKRYAILSRNSTGMRSQRGNTDLNTKFYTYAMSHVPALQEEAYITTMDDYLAKITMQLRGTNFDNVYRPQLSTWENTAQELSEHDYLGAQISRKRYYKDAYKAIEEHLSNEMPDREKVKFIYSWVNENLEWNGEYGIFIDRHLNDCFAQKTATGAELNLLLIALLREAGIEAHPALLSTRSHGKMTELYPLIRQFNHVIAFAILDGQPIVLDAGNRARPMGMLRVAALNGKAWLADPARPQWVTLLGRPGSSTYYAVATLDKDGNLSGKMSEKHEGYNAMFTRSRLETESREDVFGQLFSDRFSNASVSDISVENPQAPNEALTVRMQMSLPGAAQAIGDMIYLDPNLVKPFSESPFKLEERLYPVDIPFPVAEQFVLNLELPDGYELAAKPEPFKISLPGNDGGFSYQVTPRPGALQIVSKFSLNKLKWDPKDYQLLREFINYTIEKTSEQLVLRKAVPTDDK